MLKKLIAHYLRIGRLTIHGLSRDPCVFGSINAGYPHLDIAISLRTRWTAWKILLNPALRLGEAYMDGDLVIERGDLRSFLELCFINLRGPAPAAETGLRRLWLRTRRALQRRNDRRRARRNVAHHYDLSVDFYRRFLDADLQYSCAYFPPGTSDLEAAQQAKKDHIIAKLLLRPGQRVLDIGCGWGGLALTLARHKVETVTGITLSREQLAVARQRAEERQLGGKVSFELQDYRDAAGPFDRIVSVGMFEHVGAAHFLEFFSTISRLLTDDGVALIHAIGRIDEPGVTNGWIQKYIFPGGYVPALSETLAAIERSGLWVADIEILRLHYAETLRHWELRFAAQRRAIAELHDERFCRMWEFYLVISEMGFRYDGLMVFQLQLAKRVETLPITRDYMLDAERAGTPVPAWIRAARAS